jgi:hypothetical protein
VRGITVKVVGVWCWQHFYVIVELVLFDESSLLPDFLVQLPFKYWVTTI